MIRKKILSQKFLMSFVCVLFTAILSLCSINIYNYSTYLSASTSESVELEDEETANDDSESDIVSDDSDETIDDTEDKVTAQASGTWDDYYATSFAGGSGTSSRPWLISTAAQLARMAYLCTSNNYTSYRDDYYSLTTNIDLSAHYWVPVRYFKGNFDGNGYTVYNMTINDDSTNSSYIGLFGYIYSSSSVSIHDLTVDGTIDLYSRSGSVGGIVGSIYGNERTSITRCVSKVNIYSSADSYYYIGGIVGYGTSVTYISECMNFNGLYGYTDGGDYAVGGIIGYLVGAGNVTNCVNYATVLNDSKFCGGIVGCATDDSNITYVANFGNVYGGYDSECCTGGIVGQLGYGWYTSGNINHAINYGYVYGSGHVGRMVGYLRGVISNYIYYSSNEGHDSVGSTAGSNYDYGSDQNGYYSTSRDSIYSYTTFSNRGFSIGNGNLNSTWTKLNSSRFFNNGYMDSNFPVLSFYVNSITVYKYVQDEDGEYFRSTGGGSLYANGYSYYITSSSSTVYFLTSHTNYTLFRFSADSGFEIDGWYYHNSETYVTDDNLYSANTYSNMFQSIDIRINRISLDFSNRIYNVYSSVLFDNSENSDYNIVNNIDYNGSTMTIVSEGGTISFQFVNSSNGTGLYGNSIRITLTPNEDYEVLGLFAGSSSQNNSTYIDLNNIYDSIYSSSVGNFKNIFNTGMSSYYLNSGKTAPRFTSGMLYYNFSTEDVSNISNIMFAAVFVRYRYQIDISLTYETDRLGVDANSSTGYSSYKFDNDATLTTVNREYVYGFNTRAYLNQRGNESAKFYESGMYSSTPGIMLNSTKYLYLNGNNVGKSFFIGDYSYYSCEIYLYDNGLNEFVWNNYWGGYEEFNYTFINSSDESNITSLNMSNSMTLLVEDFVLEVSNKYYGTDYETIDDIVTNFEIDLNFREYSIFTFQNENEEIRQGAESRKYNFYLTDYYEAFDDDYNLIYDFGGNGGNSVVEIGYMQSPQLDNGLVIYSCDITETYLYIENGEIKEVEFSGDNSIKSYKYVVTITYFYEFGRDVSGELRYYNEDYGNDYFERASVNTGNNTTFVNPNSIKEYEEKIYLETESKLGYNHSGFYLNIEGTNYAKFVDFANQINSGYDYDPVNVENISGNSNVPNVIVYSYYALNTYDLSFTTNLSPKSGVETIPRIDSTQNPQLLVNLYINNEIYTVLGTDGYIYKDGVCINEGKETDENGNEISIALPLSIKAYSNIRIEINENIIMLYNSPSADFYIYKNIELNGNKITENENYSLQVIPMENIENGNNEILGLSFNYDYSTTKDVGNNSAKRAGNTYYISSEADLYYIIYQIRLERSDNLSFDPKSLKIKQTADIYLNSDSPFIPLGSKNKPFMGYYDGQNYSIYNANMDEENYGNLSNVGIFGYVDGATIKDLNIVNANIHGTENVGVVAGTIIDSTLYKVGCYNCEVMVAEEQNIDNVFIAYYEENALKINYLTTESGRGDNYIQISSESNIDNLDKTYYITYSEETYDLNDKLLNMLDGKLEKYNLVPQNFGMFAGNIEGDETDISVCFAKGTFNFAGSDSDADNVGGFVGYLNSDASGQIQNCYCVVTYAVTDNEWRVYNYFCGNNLNIDEEGQHCHTEQPSSADDCYHMFNW